ncbi:phosphomannomutase [Shewanella avicenniae]|uniref:Phosphomannomutase n=1 Tax=Shewanella avicenniae TaxID=2814294 RepID=A0ABX7QNX5_9GAMM|nr:phosphomannomutase [Shewanella avicenniae]QSX32680.1 phosphomannomutase [Shewanella avicenniae]
MASFNSQVVISESGIAFGTSGARGLVVDFTPEVCAAFTHAFVAALKAEFAVTDIAIAIDNRPSSPAMAQACMQALTDAGITPIYYGVVPTPALAYKAMQDQMPCIMVTGSHIPFDRNGLKFYRPDGEITKADEQAILAANVEFEFNGATVSVPASSAAASAYTERYLSLFPADLLVGKCIGIYEHSSAGRDLYGPLFAALGAEVVALERSNEFVPIDTEAVSAEDKAKALAWSQQYQFDAIFSTDGDGDRPLVADEQGQWLRGDILGLLCAKALEIDALAVPVSCNSSIQTCGYFNHVVLTRIGSPYVIAEFAQLQQQYANVAGFEANGGFLLGSDIVWQGRALAALPTRDALLPALMVLSATNGSRLSALVAALPARYTGSDRIKDFARERSMALLAKGEADPSALLQSLGLTEVSVSAVNTTDGLRLSLSNGTVVHLRPSGNAPELRCYAEAESEHDAKFLVNKVLTAISHAALF